MDKRRRALALGCSIFVYLVADNLLPGAMAAVPFASVADVSRHLPSGQRALLFGGLAAAGRGGHQR